MEKVKTWWCCSFRWNGKVQYFCFHWLPIRLMVVFLYRKVDGCSSCKYLLAPQHLHSNGLACHSLVNFGRLTASFEFGWYKSVTYWFSLPVQVLYFSHLSFFFWKVTAQVFRSSHCINWDAHVMVVIVSWYMDKW